MCLPDVGKDAYGGAYDRCYALHLARLADASLEDGCLRAAAEVPYAEWHACLRVVGAWRTCDAHGWREELAEPFLDHRLAVAARDAYDRDVRELAAMVCSKLLKCCYGICHKQVVGIGLDVFWQARYDKVSRALGV